MLFKFLHDKTIFHTVRLSAALWVTKYFIEVFLQLHKILHTFFLYFKSKLIISVIKLAIGIFWLLNAQNTNYEKHTKSKHYINKD